MAHIIDVIGKYFIGKKMMIGIFIAIIFILVIYWWMGRRKTQNAFDDVANSTNRSSSTSNSTDQKEQAALNSGKEAIIYFFFAEWCPHCKTAKPEWQSFKTSHHDKVVNGYVIKCREVDCTKEDADAKGMMNRFSVDSFPTIKMEKDNKVIDYDSKVSSTALKSFVDIMLV